jgi:CBS-domain-containing membrane protein
MQTIKDLMKTQTVSVVENDSIRNVATRMFENNIGFVPVVDNEQKVVGTLTDRDITLAIGKTTKQANELKVSEVMNKNVHTIRPEEDAAMGLQIMRTKQVGRLPVVDAENRLKGVVSLNSIARKVKNTGDQEQLEYEGKENIVNTLHSLAERTSKKPISV